MATRLAALSFCALLLSAGCATTERSADVVRPAAATQEETQVEEQLRLAEVQWRSHAPNNYTLRVRYSTFASTLGCNDQSFRAVKGRTKSISSPDCGARKDKFGSVPALFQFARELLAQRQGGASATFDPVYGYPGKFYVGRPGIDDAYFSFEVVAFTPEDNAGVP